MSDAAIRGQSDNRQSKPLLEMLPIFNQAPARRWRLDQLAEIGGHWQVEPTSGVPRQFLAFLRARSDVQWRGMASAT